MTPTVGDVEAGQFLVVDRHPSPREVVRVVRPGGRGPYEGQLELVRR